MPYLVRAAVSIVIKTYFPFHFSHRDEYQLRDKTDFICGSETGSLRVTQLHNPYTSFTYWRNVSLYVQQKANV